MKIAIIGTGRVGSTLGLQWAQAGHQITFGSRRAGNTTLHHLTEKENVNVQQPTDSAKNADAIALATPWPATESAIASLGDLSGKIIIDCTNPLGPNFSFNSSPGHSGGEQVAGWAQNARVVKAFNSTGAKNMRTPVIDGKKLAMFICGDDPSAKEVVIDLAETIGFEAIDSGPLSRAHYLESLAMIWITQAYQAGWGEDFGFGILRRN